VNADDRAQTWRQSIELEVKRLESELVEAFSLSNRHYLDHGPPSNLPKGTCGPLSSYYELGSIDVQFGKDDDAATVEIQVKHYTRPGRWIHVIITRNAPELLFRMDEGDELYFDPVVALMEELDTYGYLCRCSIDETTGDVQFTLG
jgi:hypothetical protein